MLGCFGKRFVVLALVLVTGGHWALLQSVAWVGMAVSFSQTATLKEALVRTFDGQHPCKLCKIVAEGKKSERKQTPQKPIHKLDLFCPLVFMTLKDRHVLAVSAVCPGPNGLPGETPPKPPPRLQFA